MIYLYRFQTASTFHFYFLSLLTLLVKMARVIGYTLSDDGVETYDTILVDEDSKKAVEERPPLLRGCSIQRPDAALIIKRLICMYPNDVNFQDSRGCTALILVAMYQRDIRIFTDLLRAGANPNLADSWGWTPLLFACLNQKSLEIIELLVSHGANAGVESSDKSTCLMALCSNPNARYETAKFLFEKGACAHTQNAQGHSAVGLAGLYGRKDLLSLFE